MCKLYINGRLINTYSNEEGDSRDAFDLAFALIDPFMWEEYGCR